VIERLQVFNGDGNNINAIAKRSHDCLELSRRFRSDFTAISQRFHRDFEAILQRFCSDFSVIGEPIACRSRSESRSDFRAISKQLRRRLRSDRVVIARRLQSGSKAIVRLSSDLISKKAAIAWRLRGDFGRDGRVIASDFIAITKHSTAIASDRKAIV
jgi:hypothetical protein